MREQLGQADHAGVMTDRRSSTDESLSLAIEPRRARRLFAHVLGFVAVAGLVALIVAPTALAGAPNVVLNEVNCTGTDWVELTNAGAAETSIGNWLLTDDRSTSRLAPATGCGSKPTRRWPRERTSS
jgi:hypothetical protein